MEKLEDLFVRFLIGRKDLRVREVTPVSARALVRNLPKIFVLNMFSPSGHEAMNLILKPNDFMLRFNGLFPSRNVIFALITRRNHEERNGNFVGIVGVNHGRVSRSCSLEMRVLASGKVDDLKARA